MLTIWLQGIWLPLHGYEFEVTPLWAGIYRYLPASEFCCSDRSPADYLTAMDHAILLQSL